MHSLILLVSGLSLFGLTLFLRAVMNDVEAYTAAGGLVVICVLFTFILKDLTPYSILRVMNGARQRALT